MANTVIYMIDNCPYCVWAKALLTKKNIAFSEINLSDNPELMSEMIAKSNGQRTMPQIFIDSFHVGGYQDLCKLDEEDELDELIK